MNRGQIWWAELNDPSGSGPCFKRPVLIIQSDSFNRSRISTVIAAAISSNLNLAQAPGNVVLPRKVSGLPKDSIINVSQIITIDKSFLVEQVAQLQQKYIKQVEKGLKSILSL